VSFGGKTIRMTQLEKNSVWQGTRTQQWADTAAIMTRFLAASEGQGTR
jgi:hypothetical protein